MRLWGNEVVVRARAIAGLFAARENLRVHDGNDRVAAIRRLRTVLVGVVMRCVRNAVERRPFTLGVSALRVRVRLASMDQHAMLGAADMLDQEHVTAGRALKKQADQRPERTNTSNH